jgi:uncharacterized protein (TIGR02996 family)
MTDRNAFKLAMVKNPTDLTIRLIFADWLDENGEHELAQRWRDESTAVINSKEDLWDYVVETDPDCDYVGRCVAGILAREDCPAFGTDWWIFLAQRGYQKAPTSPADYFRATAR